jgi:type IV pilus assembly protein PilC
MTVATIILGVLMVFVVPKFKTIFADMLEGRPLPAFTLFILAISDAIANNILITLGCVVVLCDRAEAFHSHENWPARVR